MFVIVGVGGGREPASDRNPNAIDYLLVLTLIKMERVEEIKPSLSYCNEILSITLWSLTHNASGIFQPDLNQDHTGCPLSGFPLPSSRPLSNPLSHSLSLSLSFLLARSRSPSLSPPSPAPAPSVLRNRLKRES